MDVIMYAAPKWLGLDIYGYRPEVLHFTEETFHKYHSDPLSEDEIYFFAHIEMAEV